MDSSYDRSKTIYGVWMKNVWYPSNDNIHSDGSVNINKLSIAGNLKDKDCTTLFPDLQTSYSGKYFFRIENALFKASACADSLQISVKDSAWSPNIKVSGDLKDLKEEESVSITCSAQTPCPHSPPELTWSLHQDSQRTEKNPDGTFTTKIQENMILSDTHDGDNITCSVRYPVDGGQRKKTAETNLTLSVSYAPKNTSASMVSAGTWVELSCSSRAKPPARTFTWFRNSKHGPVLVSEGQVYRFNVSERGEFYCVALNDLGNQMSPVVLLTVEGKLLFLKKNPDKHLLVLWVVVPLVLICLALSVWCFRSKRSSPQQEEELHYGEVTFKRSPEASSVPEQDEGQETVYSQVKVSKPGNRSAAPKDLYVQV
ncbi:B-cell receptor CD22-like [Nematolebias whitei]|uniref:B-cell receptor CD22-like n=1 Tax=Nematolebias whitei TaxID=451745 RepID=UPI00189944F2|nr:B-cell receptor CD22-like [Nematolebias whitei]